MPSEITFDRRVRVPENVMMRELDGESVILNLDSGYYFGLDEVGTRMWALLRDSESIQAAYEALLADYEVEPDSLQRDLVELVSKLVDNGLMRVDG